MNTLKAERSSLSMLVRKSALSNPFQISSKERELKSCASRILTTIVMATPFQVSTNLEF